jgi:hypothetical protein
MGLHKTGGCLIQVYLMHSEGKLKLRSHNASDC